MANKTNNTDVKKDRMELIKRSAQLAQELSQMKRQFAEAMLVCDTQTEAAIRAGYSKASARVKGSELMAEPDVIEYIQTLQSLNEIGAMLDNQAVIRLQYQVYERAVQADDLKAQNTALDQLAKMIGTYSGKTAGRKDETSETPKTKKETENIMDLLKDIKGRSKVHLTEN